MDEEYLQLMRIAISLETAKWMADDGWTVEKVAKAAPGELYKYSRDDEISKIWIKNASELLAK